MVRVRVRARVRVMECMQCTPNTVHS